MPKLTVTSGPAAGQSLTIDREIVVGRREADLTIEDSELSRRHFAVRPAGDGVEIEDLGSTNGTIVDGHRIDGPVTVTADGLIDLGDTKIAIEVPAPDAAGAAPDAAAAAPAAAEGGGRKRLLLAGGVLVVAALIGVGAVLLLGGDDDKGSEHTVAANITAPPLGDPASFQVSGALNGEPLDNTAVVIQRRFAEPPVRGGKAVAVNGFMLLTPPGGSLALNFTGKLRLTRSGGEVFTAKAVAGNGVREYQDVTGVVRVRGGRTSPKVGLATYRLTGNLDY